MQLLAQTPVLLLAAGSSSRLGSPKQLLALRNTTLLEHALAVATAVSGTNTFVVLGAAADQIFPVIAGSTAQIIFNKEWKEGMASSIRAGIKFIRAQQDASHVIIMVCDQPFLDATHVLKLISLAEETRKGIIASEYEQTTGTPVLFRHNYFDDLLNLRGDNGARGLFAKYAGDLLTVPFKNGEMDIDTVLDYEKLKEHDHG